MDDLVKIINEVGFPIAATLGLGYTFSNGNTNVNVGYEAEANNDDYFGHSGSLKLVTKF